MAVPAAPTSLTAEQSDGQVLLTWAESAGATSYQIQRSTDGTNFTNLATTAGIQYQYIDAQTPPGNLTPALGTMYWYQVAGINGSGTGAYSPIANMVPSLPSEMSLFELRIRARQKADRLNSQFVTDSELNTFVRLAAYELYDLIMDSYEDYFSSEFVYIQTNGTTQNYQLPDGVSNYLGGNYNGTTGTPAKAFYKAAGLDLAVNTSTVSPAWVTLVKFNFIDRNKFVYPNSTSTIFGIYNMRFRIMGNALNIIPTPAGNQTIRMWYAPKLPRLMADTDITNLGFSGWLDYVIVRAAMYMLTKEEGSDTSALKEELLFLKTRIEQASQNRDISMPDTISNVRSNAAMSGIGGDGGWGGGQAGW
jgi:hypothetical protein